MFGYGKILDCIDGVCQASESYTWQDINKTVTPNDNEVPMAYLKVYSEIKSQNSDGYEYERGIPYTIYTPGGRKVRSVEDRGFTPDLIALLPGKCVVAVGIGEQEGNIWCGFRKG